MPGAESDEVCTLRCGPVPDLANSGARMINE